MKETIHNAITKPDKYIEGNIFSDNANNIIQGYYDLLRDNIKIKLGL